MNNAKKWEPELIAEHDDKSWRFGWLGQSGNVYYRLAGSRDYRDLTFSWRDRDGRWTALPVPMPEKYGLVRPAATADEFEAVVRDYLDHGPNHKHYTGPLNGPVAAAVRDYHTALLNATEPSLQDVLKAVGPPQHLVRRTTVAALSDWKETG